MQIHKSLTIAGIGLAFLALAGCGSTSSQDSAGAIDMAVMEPESVSSESVQFDQRESEQFVTRNSSISLQGSNVANMAQSVLAVTEAFAGTISQQDIRNENEQSYASLTVRVPDNELDAYLSALSEIGKVTYLSTSSLDVTTTVIDLDARIETLNTSITRLAQLQTEAANVADLVAVESELTARTAERDSLVAQREFLQDQVDLSTVYVDIAADPATSTDSPNFLQGIQDGWNALINALAATITFAGFLIPILGSIFLLAIVIVAIVLVIKRVRQQK